MPRHRSCSVGPPWPATSAWPTAVNRSYTPVARPRPGSTQPESWTPMKRLSIRPSLTPTPPLHPPTAPMSVASAGMKQAWLQVVTERPGVKKEWGTQKSILPAPPVAFRPRPSSSCGLPGEPHGGDAQPPVWPGAAAHTAAPAGTAGSPPIIAAPALPHATLPLVERSAADSTSDRLAFITQCLQVLLTPPEPPPPTPPCRSACVADHLV